MYKYAVFVIVSTLVASGFADVCQTCYGIQCDLSKIPEVACSENTRSLPFGFQTEGTNHLSSSYACIQLEYAKDSALLKQRQCVLVEEKEDVCSEIESNLPEDVALNVCVVTQAKRSVADELEDDELILFNESSRSAKDDNNRDDEEGSGEGEDGAGAITVSLALLAAAFFFVLIN